MDNNDGESDRMDWEDDGDDDDGDDTSTSAPERELQQEGDLSCNVCEKSFTTKYLLKRHKTGKRHKEREREKGTGPKVKRQRCELCQVDVINLRSHRTTIQHKNKLKEKKRIVQNPDALNTPVNVKQEQPSTSHSGTAAIKQQDFSVAIIKLGKGILSQEVADKILRNIQQRIIDEAQTSSKKGPVFKGTSFTDGHLRVECEDQYTVTWLKKTISDMALPSGEKLALKKLADIASTRICITIPDPQGIWKEKNATEVISPLAYQNKWAQCERWVWVATRKPTNKQKSVVMIFTVPNDVVPIIVEKNNTLSCLLGAACIKYQGPGGKFYDKPPGETDQSSPASPEMSPPKTNPKAVAKQDPEIAVLFNNIDKFL